METKKFFSTKSMVLMALFTAVTCILAPLSIPIGPVPISLTNLVIYFSMYLLGWKQGTITYIVYLLIGLVGLPVFSGFTGGVGKLAGPTGGYLIGFIPMAILCGIMIEKWYSKLYMCLIGMVVGTAVAYAFGTIWFCYSTGTGVWAALTLCVFPFIIGDLVKMIFAGVLAPIVGKQIRKIQ